MRKYLILLALLAGATSLVTAVPTLSASGASRPHLSAGLGVGVMYGGLGTNIEYRVNSQAAVTAGVGLDGQNEWLAGARYYFKPEGEGPRGRVTLGVGDVTTKSDNPFSDERKTRAIAAIGWTWANAANNFRGISIDLSTRGDFPWGISSS